MGGIAFSLKDPRGLNTPRMPPNVYRQVRDHCHSALRKRFMAVASPIEAPAKKDYGDVDVFVAWDKTQTPLGNFEDIGQLLGAPYARVDDLVNCEAQFAVPWPEGLDEPDGSVYELNLRYCQIDLHICQSINELHWMLWYYAHGDLKPMIQNMIRPFNITISTKGLFLRIPEIRNGSKRILITNEPSEALRLLDYDPFDPAWEHEFTSIEQLFKFTTKCRFFGGFHHTELTGEDGRIMAVRDVFKSWVADFIPTCVDSHTEAYMTSDQVRAIIFDLFPKTKAEYKLALLKAKKRKRSDLINHTIKPCIPLIEGMTTKWHNVASTALVEIIMDLNYSLGFAPTRLLRDVNGNYNEQEVRVFVKEAWKLVGDAAWDRQYGPMCKYGQCLEKKASEAEYEGENRSDEEPQTEDDDEGIKFPSRPEGFRQTCNVIKSGRYTREGDEDSAFETIYCEDSDEETGGLFKKPDYRDHDYSKHSRLDNLLPKNIDRWMDCVKQKKGNTIDPDLLEGLNMWA
ncbi:hypothetical protein BKA67DRAFT_657098 [Truncatella angustata]|uniref:Uncharacterized protein n=1 Tax=Truncatella angustata TaxID=152316 RepID=A0A9P8UMS5_9PEZI|nr:uncharacterized protein BKA67DRAFT_657098 [Truncatella angustata]KAH6655141.1 hypothetical protein BKA67DRAFT_657098 [Truncatella angustata]